MRYASKRCYEWSANTAYITGLMTSDGCLSKDGRHLDITSVDIEQLKNFQIGLGRVIKIDVKKNQHPRTAYRIQFSDVAFYDFLKQVGLTPNKSKTIGKLTIPDEFYADFLRGLYDGDGSSNAYWDKRWKSSYMYYTKFTSASPEFLDYVRSTNQRLFAMGAGSISKSARVLALNYAKKDGKLLYKKMYYSEYVLCLSRKKKKLKSFINIDNIDKLKPGSCAGGVTR